MQPSRWSTRVANKSVLSQRWNHVVMANNKRKTHTLYQRRKKSRKFHQHFKMMRNVFLFLITLENHYWTHYWIEICAQLQKSALCKQLSGIVQFLSTWLMVLPEQIRNDGLWKQINGWEIRRYFTHKWYFYI